MNYKLFIDNKKMLTAASLLLDRWDKGVNFKKITLKANKADIPGLAWKLEINKDNAYALTYTKKAYFFKALATLNAMLETGEAPELRTFPLEEAVGIQHLGVSLDCSRNAAFTVTAIKTLITDMACCGMDELYLYLEDLYPIEGYPYFGYMRGRYTEEEIQEIITFAKMFGIEIIPSIQTLAHLATTLHWEYAKVLKDTSDILFVDSEEVHHFIEAMIKSIAGLFGGTKIHVGMDEAEGLGLGARLGKKGYEEKASLMARHLDMVVKLCRKYGMEPMVWSDMFFKSASPTGSYYTDSTGAKNPFSKAIPEDVTLVYWDYYHLESDHYAKQIAKHKGLSPSVAFAGGAWTWGGIAPNYSLAMKSTEAALAACKEQGVERAFCTLWFDNGAETPLATALPMIAYFANCAFKQQEEFPFTRWFKSVFGLAWESFLLLDKFDHLPGGEEHNRTADNPSKWFFYQDPMLGLFDLYATKVDIDAYYSTLAQELGKVKPPNGRFALLFAYYEAVAQFLSVKASLGLVIKAAYDKDDREALENTMLALIPEAIPSLAKVQEYRQRLWFMEAKPFGFEVLDLRLSGLEGRLKYASNRIWDYLHDMVDRLEELEEPRLLFRERETTSTRAYCASNSWREIVTAGTV